MSKICQITGKKAMIGNNVSHSKRRTKRTFDVNLLLQKFMVSPAKDANKKNCMQTNKRIRFMVSVKRKRG